MATVETLTTVWDAKFDKFEQKLNTIIRVNAAASDKIEKAWAGVNDNMDRGFDRGGKGLASFRGNLLATAAGAATATAALTALTVAFNQVTAAMQFGEDTQTTAQKLQLTAEAVQELQFAAGETDVPVDDLTASLERLNVAIGAMKQGTASKGVVNAFKALGIDRDTLANITNANDLLPLLADRLGQVSDTASQVHLAKKIGVAELLPLLRLNSDGLAEMRERAHELGLVVSNDTVKALAEANREMEVATKQIQTSLTIAFAGVAGDIADATKALAGWIVQLRGLIDQAPRAVAVLGELARAAIMPFGSVGRIQRAIQPQTPQVSVRQIEDYFGIGATKVPEFKLTPAGGSGRTARSPAPPRDTTQERTEQVNAAVAAASRDMLRAMLDLTTNTADRAGIEKQIAEEEARLAAARIAKLSADIADDKGLKPDDKALLQLQLEAARIEADRVASLKAGAIDRDAANKTARDELDLQLQGLDAQAEILRIQAAMARSAEQRRIAELALLDLADRRAEAELNAIIATQGVADAEAKLAQQKLDALKANRGAREAEVRQGTMGPAESFIAEYSDAGANIERMEAAGVRAFENLADGLADAIANAESLGDVARSVFNQLIADLLSQSIKSAGASIFSAILGIPAHANGTNFAPGGPSLVGERGPEIVNLPRGAQVIPNNKLRTSDIKSGVAAVTIIQPVTLDLRHAVTTPELLKDINTRMEQSRKFAVAEATRIASKAGPSRMQEYRLLGT